MSLGMAMALEFTQEWLRTKNGWTPQQCGVQYEAKPALDAGHFYVAIDDAGIEPGNETTDSIKEILRIDIGIWIRPEHLAPKDLRGFLKLPQDLYLERSITLADLHQKVVLSGRNGLHNNYDFLAGLNARYQLPDNVYGAMFNQRLSYKGRGRMEPLGVDDGNVTQAWFGYRLSFRGLDREQKLRSLSDAQG